MFFALGATFLEVADTLDSSEIDEDVGEGILVGDGAAIAQFGAFDTKFFGLRVDAFGGGALFVDFFVFFALAVKLVTDASAVGGVESGLTATFGKIFVFDRASSG